MQTIDCDITLNWLSMINNQLKSERTNIIELSVYESSLVING